MPAPQDRVPGLYAVILAARASRRLGRAKQLLLHEGRTLVERAAEAAGALCGARVVVVVGASADAVAARLAGRPLQLVRNERWSEGMGGSLAAGVASLPPGGCEGVLVLLSDQPLVPLPALRAMAALWRERPERLVAAEYRGTAGVPAIFPARLLPALAALGGDQGARAVIAAEGSDAVRFPLPEAAFDVDDAEAAEALARMQAEPPAAEK